MPRSSVYPKRSHIWAPYSQRDAIRRSFPVVVLRPAERGDMRVVEVGDANVAEFAMIPIAPYILDRINRKCESI